MELRMPVASARTTSIRATSSSCTNDKIPFAPEAILSLVHVEDVARMLVVLAEATGIRSSIYNAPAELWQARDLKRLIEEGTDIWVQLGHDGALAGPVCDGSRFVREFGFKLRGLRE